MRERETVCGCKDTNNSNYIQINPMLIFPGLDQENFLTITA